MEGLNWVLLDYVNVVVHVFRPSFREFYRLEDLWGDADARPVTDEAKLAVAAQPKKRATPRATRPRGTVKAARTQTRRPKTGTRVRQAKKAPKSES
jgi:ribosome-associated protein